MIKSIGIAVIAFVLGGLVAYFASDYEGREQRPLITEHDTHNNKMNECVTKALERHAGAVLEVELEKEDAQWVFDIDVQGKDGETWDVECDMNSAEIIEDSPDKD